MTYTPNKSKYCERVIQAIITQLYLNVNNGCYSRGMSNVVSLDGICNYFCFYIFLIVAVK